MKISSVKQFFLELPFVVAAWGIKKIQRTTDNHDLLENLLKHVQNAFLTWISNNMLGSIFPARVLCIIVSFLGSIYCVCICLVVIFEMESVLNGSNTV